MYICVFDFPKIRGIHMKKKYSLILIALLFFSHTSNSQCLTDDFNSGYGNWTENGTYQNGTAGLNGNGTGFNDIGDEIITTSTYTNPQTLTMWLARSTSADNRTLSIQYSTSNTGPWTSARDILVEEVTTTHQEFTIDINQTGDYYIRIAITQRTGGSYYIDDLEMTCATGPTIFVNPSLLTGFTYFEGSGPSGVQSFVVSGSNLTDDIDVTPPTNWEISTAIGGPYQTTALSYTPVSGTVTNQTIYTRMVSGLLNSGSPYSGNITAVSLLDGLSENIAVDGTVNVPGTGDIIITQYYEGSGNNKWIEVKNISGGAIAANSYYIATYNQGPGPSYNERPLNGTPNQSVAIPAMAIDEIIRFKEPSTTIPSYAVPGETGYDGNNTEDMFSSSFSGDDIIVISPTNGSNCYIDRIDMIGEYSVNGTNWGDRRCFVRKECSASSPSTTFDINDWIEFTDAEVVNPTTGTNPYLGEHYTGSTTFTGGGWNNGSPDRSRGVIISDDYITSAESSFESCSLIITANNTLDITDGHYVGVETDVTINTNANLEIRNQGQLVQVEETGTVTNDGTTNVRKTTATMNQYDYVYWSSPVDYGPPTPPLGIAFVLTEFLPDRMYRFNTASFEDDQPTADGDGFDDNQDDWVLYSSYMEPGIGYAAMTANTGPAVNNVVFSGTINNGPIDITISLSADGGGDSDGDIDDWNLVGNPYPSAISADSLVSQNSNIDGTLYFWTHNTPIAGIAGPDALNFSSNDYAMYNASGGVGTAANSGGAAPTGRIASGQGFFVDAVANGTLSFNNSMRNIAIANDDFFRSTSSNNTVAEKTRMWLNLTNPDGAYSQILIGYFEGATNFKDRLYDGVRIKGTNYIDFYSMDAGLMEYGIQGRDPFNEFDVVRLGYNSNITGELSIELHQREGQLVDQSVFLRDKFLNIVHDLTHSAYTFESQLGNTDERFEIIYNQETLTTESTLVSINDLIIFEAPTGVVNFKLNSPFQFESIEIIDLLGRTLYNLDGQGQSEKSFNLSGLSTATYLVRATLTNGQIVTKKAVKKL